MSKKNNNNQHLKQRIREQDGQIKHLEAMNHHLMMRLNNMAFKQYKQYAVAMCCLHEQVEFGNMPEALAGELMLAMTDAWDFTYE